MKGISPMVAEVLLIALVVAVFGIIISWITGFTRVQIKTTNKQSSTELSCSYGGIKFMSTPSVTYNSTTGNLTGAVENNGNVALGNIRLQILYNNSTLQTITISSELSPGDISYFNVHISSNYQMVRVTTNCTSPEVSDELTSDEITSTS